MESLYDTHDYSTDLDIRPNKNYLCFRVTRPFLNVLVKPRIFFRFSGKNRILCIMKGLYFFQKKKIVTKNNMCADTFFFIWPKMIMYWLPIFFTMEFYKGIKELLIIEMVLLSTHNICFA